MISIKIGLAGMSLKFQSAMRAIRYDVTMDNCINQRMWVSIRYACNKI